MSRYRTNVALAIKGTRLEKGTEIELTKEESAHIDPADLTPVKAIAAPEPEPVLADVPLAEMSLAQLKDRAKELELSTSGTKADLRERITLHLSGNGEN